MNFITRPIQQLTPARTQDTPNKQVKTIRETRKRIAWLMFEPFRQYDGTENFRTLFAAYKYATGQLFLLSVAVSGTLPFLFRRRRPCLQQKLFKNKLKRFYKEIDQLKFSGKLIAHSALRYSRVKTQYAKLSAHILSRRAKSSDATAPTTREQSSSATVVTVKNEKASIPVKRVMNPSTTHVPSRKSPWRNYNYLRLQKDHLSL